MEAVDVQGGGDMIFRNLSEVGADGGADGGAEGAEVEEVEEEAWGE